MSDTAVRLGGSAATRDTRAIGFLTAAAAWMLALFAFLKAPWVELNLLTPLAAIQEAFARAGLTGPPRVSVTLDCAGADVMALCAGALLAFPVSWPRRLLAAALSFLWVLLLNSLRIAVLERTAGSTLFELLHLYVLPALLQLAAAAYVFAWIWWWTGRRTSSRPAGGVGPAWSRARLARLAMTMAVLLGLYALVTPSLAESRVVALSASWLAGAAAFCLNLLGATARATGAILETQRGGFSVTAECVLTPLMPVALAAALTWPSTLRTRALLLLAIGPVFMGLNLARLLVLALPIWILGSPLFVTHGFRQGVLGLACIAWATWWRSDPKASRAGVATRGLAAVCVSVIVAMVAGPSLVQFLLFLASQAQAIAPHALTTLALRGDDQGALQVLPAFQLGLLAGLLVARRASARWSALALTALVVLQVTLLITLGELAAHTSFQAPALLLRGMAVAAPLVLALAASGVPLSRSYERFWHDVGEQFPDLGGAASTDFYRANEIRLFEEHLGPLQDRRVFKTDLWDEARNTRILQWVHSQGASTFGSDISSPTVIRAREGFGPGGLHAALGDVRCLPFAGESFDLVYSMGTIEHFADSRGAAAEILRVLKPGHRAIVGVPNRMDPFLRPLLVSALSAVGLYDYGYERSFTRAQIRAVLQSVGFVVVAEPAILFIPGWLRMLDLWCHCHCRPLTRATAPLVSVFVWLDHRFPKLRRFGYLLATVVVRPPNVR